MNYFYAPKQDWPDEHTVDIKGQEAQHISKVLRKRTGEIIHVADGAGSHFACEIISVSKQQIQARVVNSASMPEPEIKKVMAFGAIKKRDRLEFAVEKAVELDAWEVCVFNADHSERTRLNEHRLNAHIVSAFKQSGRYFIPRMVIKNSLDEVLDHYIHHQPYMAYLGDVEISSTELTKPENLLLVGPEGGFSEREAGLVKKKGGKFIRLGRNRLRAETGVAAFLAQYLYT